MKRALSTLPAMLAVSMALPAQAQRFEIIDTIRMDAAARIVTSDAAAFGRAVRLRNLIAPDRETRLAVRNLILTQNLTDKSGRKIVSFDYDTAGGVIIASSGPSVEILNAFEDKGLRRYVIGSYDPQSGFPVRIGEDLLAAFDAEGNAVGYSFGTETARAPMAFHILIDRSGSMDGHMAGVIAALHRLLGALPQGENSACFVTLFADEVSPVPGINGAKCAPANFPLEDVAAEGTTSLYAALGHAFTEFARPEYAQAQKVVIVLTDGAPSDEDTELARLKGRANTVFFWLGDKAEGAEQTFGPLADYFISDSPASLEAYLDHLAASVNAQSILTLTDPTAQDFAAQVRP